MQHCQGLTRSRYSVKVADVRPGHLTGPHLLVPGAVGCTAAPLLSGQHRPTATLLEKHSRALCPSAGQSRVTKPVHICDFMGPSGILLLLSDPL